jgi:hypothetical protein
MQPVEQLLVKLGFSRKLIPSITNLTQIEHAIDFSLPEDYKFYLTNFLELESDIGPEYLCLWDSTEILRMNREYNILNALPNTVAIGSNMSGEFIGIEYAPSNQYRLILSPLIDLDIQHHIEIGDSFTDFLARLDSGQTWFDDIN